MKNQNFALVLTGHMRCWEMVYPNTLDRFIKVYNPDIFISTWDDEGYWVSPDKDLENKGINSYSPKLNILKVTDAYNPVALEVDSFETLSPEFSDLANEMQPLCDQIRPVNIVSQFYKIHRGYNLMTDHVMKTGKTYNWVIRMRPDMVVTGNLPNPADLSLWKGNEILTIDHPNHNGRGVGDMFMLSGYTYSTLFNGLLTLYSRMAKAAGVFCPHILTEKLIAGLPDHKHYNQKIEKVIMHTPNGQYKNWSPNET